MANIKLIEPDGPYGAEINTGVMRTFITEAYIGVTFVTADGEVLDVHMRDSGFELTYKTKTESQIVTLNEGDVTTRSN
jgi:hypothetical protein